MLGWSRKRHSCFFSSQKKRTEKCFAALQRSAAAARSGPAAVGAAGKSPPQFSPVCLTTSGWSPGEARRREGSPRAKPALAAKNGVYMPKTIGWRQTYFSPRQIFYWVVNPARASGDWCRSPTWGSIARPIGKPKNLFSIKKKKKKEHFQTN